jgi:hypothetical protein
MGFGVRNVRVSIQLFLMKCNVPVQDGSPFLEVSFIRIGND